MAQTGSPFACKTDKARRKFYACDAPREKARFGSFALVDKGVITPGLKGAALVAAILAAELICKATVYREVAGSYDGGSPVMGRSGGRLTERQISLTHTVTIGLFDYVGNETHWQGNVANSKDYDAFFFTSSRAWPAQDKDLGISVVGGIVDDPNADIEATATIRWNHPDPLISIEADVPALDVKPFLAFTGLTNEAGSTATIDANTETVTVATGATLDVLPEFEGAVDFMLKDGSSLPNWLTLTPTGHLTGTAPATASTTVVTIQAETVCGILGEVEVTVIVA